VPILPETTRVEIILSYRGQKVDGMILPRYVASGLNPRIDLLRAVTSKHWDMFMKDIREGRDIPSDKVQTRFEEAYLKLMQFLGFSGIHTGKDTSAPDSVIWSGNPEVFILIECTLGLPSKEDKYRRLLERVNSAKTLTKNPRIMGILVTARPKGEIPDEDKKQIAASGIVLLCSENIDELVSMALRGSGTGEVIEYIEKSPGGKLHAIF
jgi:hypothetical protein